MRVRAAIHSLVSQVSEGKSDEFDSDLRLQPRDADRDSGLRPTFSVAVHSATLRNQAATELVGLHVINIPQEALQIATCRSGVIRCTTRCVQSQLADFQYVARIRLQLVDRGQKLRRCRGRAAIYRHQVLISFAQLRFHARNIGRM